MITRTQLPSHIGQWPWLNPNPHDISESKNRKVIVLAQDHKWYTRYTSQHRNIRLTGSRPMNPATHHQTTGRIREAIWELQQMESIHKTVAKKSRKAEGRMKPSQATMANQEPSTQPRGGRSPKNKKQMWHPQKEARDNLRSCGYTGKISPREPDADVTTADHHPKPVLTTRSQSCGSD